MIARACSEWSRAHEHHRLDPGRLLRGDVQQRLGAETQANRAEALDAEMVQQLEYVMRGLPECECP